MNENVYRIKTYVGLRSMEWSPEHLQLGFTNFVLCVPRAGSTLHINLLLI